MQDYCIFAKIANKCTKYRRFNPISENIYELAEV